MSRYHQDGSPWTATPAGLLLLGLTAAGFVGGPARARAESNDPGTVIATIPVSDPRLVAVNPRTNRVYVIDDPYDIAQPWTTAPRVLVYDGGLQTLVTSVPLPAGSAFHRVEVNATTNRLYVTDYFGNTITVINGVTNRVLTTVRLTAGSYLFDLAANPATNRVYTTNFGGDAGYLWVINGTTNRMLNTVVLGSAGFGVAVNPTSNRIYAGQMEVFGGVTHMALGTVSVEGGASGVAVNPATKRVYAIGGPSENNGGFVGGHVAVIVECTLDAEGNFVCP